MAHKLFYWSFALVASIVLAVRHLVVVLPRAYGTDVIVTSATCAAVLTIAMGACFTRASRPRPVRLTVALTALSLTATSGAYLLWWAVPHGGWLAAALVGFAAAGGLAAGVALSLAARAYATPFAELGSMASALDPLRAAALSAALLGLVATFSRLGLLRTGALLGLLVGCVAVFSPLLDEALDRPEVERAPRTLPGLALGAALLATGGASRWVPLSDVQMHAGDVLYVVDGARGRHVVTRVQRAILLFTNDVLASTGTDSQRFAEALVHPALAVRASSLDTLGPSKRGLRVLTFGNSAGSVEREILRYPAVERVLSVVADRRLAELAGTSSLLVPLGGGGGADPRLVRVEAEAAPFILALRERFDVILADFGDPISYAAGKHYTRHFFGAVRAALEPEGLFALQLTSPLRTPHAHATVLATLRAAGFGVAPYRAPLPTLGEWGFALAYAPASSERVTAALGAAMVPPGTSLVTARTLRDLFVEPPSAGTLPPAMVNYLHEQPIVGLYRDEDRKHWQ